MKRGHQERSHRNARPKPGLRSSIEQVLLDVAQILQSATGWRLRLLRTFELIAELVPYDRCALLEAPAGVDPFLVILPELLPEARAAHNRVLVEHLGRLALGPMPERRGDSGPREPYLVVPLMGIDEVVGVLHVSRAGQAYTERQWLVLTLIGAQLGAYLTMLRSRAADVVRCRALEEAQRSETAAIREKDALLALVARELGAGRAVVEVAVEPEGSCEWCSRPEDVMPEVAAERSMPERRPLDGISVLLVDDDFDIRDAFQLVLEQSGAVVRSAESASAALTVLTTWRPDVLLSDLSMPGQSGFELMQRVAARVDAPPAAALTAHATREGRAQALAAGFRLYVGKPLESAELVETVAVLAGRRVASPTLGNL